MKYLAASTLMLVALSACPSDDGDDTGADTGGMTSPTSTMTTNGMSTTGMSTGDVSTSGMTGMETTESGGTTSTGAETSMGGAPVINSVTWTHAEGCMMSVVSDVEVVVDATDPDGDELMFSGMSTGCTGAIDAATVTLSCPQLSPYPSTVTVSDPDGNEADLDFSIEPCVDGSAP